MPKSERNGPKIADFFEKFKMEGELALYKRWVSGAVEESEKGGRQSGLYPYTIVPLTCKFPQTVLYTMAYGHNASSCDPLSIVSSSCL